MRIITFGLLLLGMVTSFSSLAPPLFGYKEIAFSDVYAAILWTGAVTYAITRYRFMDVRVVLKKSVVYGGTLVTMLALFLTGTFLLYRAIDTVLIWILAILAVVALQRRLQQIIKQFLDDIFFHDELDLSKQLSQSIHRLESTQEIQTFVQELGKSIQQIVPATMTQLFIREPEHARYFSITSKMRIAFDDPVLDIIRHHNSGFIIADEFEHHQSENAARIKKFLKKYDGHVVMRLGNILGLAMLTQKSNGKPYTIQELQQLEYLRVASTSALNQLLKWHETLQRAKLSLQEHENDETTIQAVETR